MKIEQYFKEIEKEVKNSYLIAGEAKKKGFDPVMEVEVPLATSLAERVIGLVSVLYPQINDQRIVQRILELEKQYGNLDPAVALVIAEEIAKEKFCKFTSHKECLEAGIRIAIGYLTLGYVSSPIEGFIKLEIKKTRNGEDFLAPYYSGPIRSAGGSEAAFSLVIVDHLREIFGYAKYDPTPDEIKRASHECYEYHDRITNLQYLPSEMEIEFLMANIPIQLTGDASEEREVFNYKDLDRVETNFLRSGFCLVLGEGIAQKAPKVFGRVTKLKQKGFKLSGWDWLGDFVALQKKIKEGKAGAGRAGATYIQDLVAGRPVFSHPGRSGGFRLRYGRGRNTGYSTLALHPGTLAVTNGFIAIGTQLKIEKPTKGCTVAVCDSIDGPIVKLKNGNVIKIKSFEEGKKAFKEIEQIVYLGDILVPFGDFLNRNHPLEKQGYCIEYWNEEVNKKGISYAGSSFDEAVKFCAENELSLHPDYIYYWNEINYEQFLGLIDWIARGEIRENVLVLPYKINEKDRFAKGKEALGIIGCEHIVSFENVVLNEFDTKALLFNLGIDLSKNIEEQVNVLSKKISNKGVLELINELCSLKVRDKSGTFIGARMGRPEKAKLRKLTGNPHVLFPVGNEGGRLRSIQSALEAGGVRAEFSIYYCDKCKHECIYPRCEECEEICKKLYHCDKCMKNSLEKCEEHNLGDDFEEKYIDVLKYFDSARRKMAFRTEEIPMLKGVKGTSNKDHSCEYLGKGLLRARYGLCVNKDGTIRYDMTEMPITQFKPLEVGTSIQKLKELGYEYDIYGKALERNDQILEMFPHDIILPSCPDTPDEKADDVFVKVAGFIDEELEKIYKSKSFFNAKHKEELIGTLFACMSPHTSASVVGRLIGFSKIQALLASPYIHAAMRRDCDGDEAAVMMLMDLLLNFSRKFIPSHRGGTQDAPLVLNMRIRASEVDDMIFDLDTGIKLPLELFELGEKHGMPSEINLEKVKGRLGGDREFTDLGFSKDTYDINEGQLCSSYKTLPTMQEKVESMMDLCTKIRAVDVKDVSRLIIERHFIRDTRGNLRKFSQQGFRCVACNAKFRRPPLQGKCNKCGGKLIFTISEGSILKYMQPALDLAKKYDAEPYLAESLELTKMYIESIFGREKEKQEALKKWF
jgi:DNA polymerase II large subunit